MLVYVYEESFILLFFTFQIYYNSDTYLFLYEIALITYKKILRLLKNVANFQVMSIIRILFLLISSN